MSGKSIVLHTMSSATGSVLEFLDLTKSEVHVFNSDSLEKYDNWKSPVCIISDGPYGIGGFPGDPLNVGELVEWYRPHIKAWTENSTPLTTLWFWNTEQGWATVHNEIVSQGWDFVNCHIWDKGKAHIAGNVNTKTLRKLPVVTEVCVQYVRRAEIKYENEVLELKEWLRREWKRTGLPMSKTNEACGVKDAATRKYFTNCHLWYFPPSEAFEKIVLYANANGNPDGKPYFSLDGRASLSKSDWEKMRSKFTCPYGINNVWREPSLKGKERLRSGTKSLHLNQKPISLMKQIIEMSTDEGDIVWEPFGGLFSGTLAANLLHREAYSCEINREVYEHGLSRLQEYVPSDYIIQ